MSYPTFPYELSTPHRKAGALDSIADELEQDGRSLNLDADAYAARDPRPFNVSERCAILNRRAKERRRMADDLRKIARWHRETA